MFTDETQTKSPLVSGRPKPEVYRLLCPGFFGHTNWKNCECSDNLLDEVLDLVKNSVVPLCSLAEPEDGVEGGLSSAATGQQQPSASAGVHVPSPGVGHQHGLLQPVDGPPVEMNGSKGSFLQGDIIPSSIT